MQHRLDREETNQHRWNSQQDQRQGNNPWRLVWLLTWCQTVVLIMAVVVMRVMCMIIVTMVSVSSFGMCVVVMMCVLFTETLFTVEYQEVHTEGVERRDEYTSQYSKVSESGTEQVGCVHCFDDAVLRIETREQRCTNQCQRTEQGSDPGNRHVFTLSLIHI